MTSGKSIFWEVISRSAVVLTLGSIPVLLLSIGREFWGDDSSTEAGAYNAAVDEFVPRVLEKQTPFASAYLFSRRGGSDIRHEGKYHTVMGTVTVRDFDGKDLTKDFICLVSFDSVAKRWSDVGTRVQ